MNQTILKFGYPQGLIQEYEHWVILLRPQQVTLGDGEAKQISFSFGA